MTGAARDPLSGLPIGPEVGVGEASAPARVVLEGRHVRIEPLDPPVHAASLYRETHDADRHARFQYLFEAPFAGPEAFRAHLELKAASADPLFFVVIDRGSGEAVGQLTLMRIDRGHRSIEIGNILFGRRLQGTAGSTEAQYLVMRYVFETLGYRRYEWKCNALNEPSRRTALRLGFAFEGVFRKHFIVRGRSRDTAWYAIVDDDWPWARAGFEAWLSPANFDAAGRQRRPLGDCRGPRPRPAG